MLCLPHLKSEHLQYLLNQILFKEKFYDIKNSNSSSSTQLWKAQKAQVIVDSEKVTWLGS